MKKEKKVLLPHPGLPRETKATSGSISSLTMCVNVRLVIIPFGADFSESFPELGDFFVPCADEIGQSFMQTALSFPVSHSLDVPLDRYCSPFAFLQLPDYRHVHHGRSFWFEDDVRDGQRDAAPQKSRFLPRELCGQS